MKRLEKILAIIFFVWMIVEIPLSIIFYIKGYNDNSFSPWRTLSHMKTVVNFTIPIIITFALLLITMLGMAVIKKIFLKILVVVLSLGLWFAVVLGSGEVDKKLRAAYYYHHLNRNPNAEVDTEDTLSIQLYDALYADCEREKIMTYFDALSMQNVSHVHNDFYQISLKRGIIAATEEYEREFVAIKYYIKDKNDGLRVRQNLAKATRARLMVQAIANLQTFSPEEKREMLLRLFLLHKEAMIEYGTKNLSEIEAHTAEMLEFVENGLSNLDDGYFCCEEMEQVLIATYKKCVAE